MSSQAFLIFEAHLTTLERPSSAYAESFFAAMAEFAAECAPQAPASLTREGFEVYVQGLLDAAEGKGLKPGYIPSREFWIVDGEGYAGRIIVGLALPPGPPRPGNHVGYAVRPSRRRRGYATRALGLLLPEARKAGIERLMPVCDEDNVASRRVIEANGGVLLDRQPGRDGQLPALRYLIDLTQGGMVEQKDPLP